MPSPNPIPLRTADEIIPAGTPLTVRYQLAQPIQQGDDVVTELVLRRLTSEDIRLCGHPMKKFSGDGFDFDVGACSRLLARLTSLPMSMIDQLHPYDWQEAAMELVRFFRQPGRIS